MFENIIEQPAASQIENDIKSGNLAQSLLFFGPSETAKGSAALELARVLSCENDALTQTAWKCECASCQMHRFLQHDDLIVLGKRKFSSEISAFSSIFLNDKKQSTKHLFYRALRKLQMRFSPVFTQEDAKISKLSSVLQSFDEKMNDLYSLNLDKEIESEKQIAAVEKLCKDLVKDAKTLEEKGISRNIPVAQIRAVSYWCRLAPSGKRKVLIIENADNSKDEAQNSLLKLLEEPPQEVSIILTAQRRESFIPTILSRLRPYRFLIRSPDAEKEILERVFQVKEITEDAGGRASLISRHLDSFLSSGQDMLYPLAKWFTEQDYGSPMTRNAQIVKTLLAKSSNFENDSFSRFLTLCLEITSKEARIANDPKYIKYYDLYKKHINEALAAVDVYNQTITLALEALLFKLKTKTGVNHA